MIESFVVGKDMVNVNLSQNEKNELAKEIGQLLQLIHSIETKGLTYVK
jgi:hypothetical protein